MPAKYKIITATSDLHIQQIHKLLTDWIPVFKSSGIEQWDERYPKIDHIQKGCTYFLEIDNNIELTFSFQSELSLAYTKYVSDLNEDEICVQRIAKRHHSTLSGDALFDAIIEKAKELNYSILYADTESTNLKALAWFDKYSWSALGKIQYDGYKSDYILFKHEL